MCPATENAQSSSQQIINNLDNTNTEAHQSKYIQLGVFLKEKAERTVSRLF
jgi:hypothetical protein